MIAAENINSFWASLVVEELVRNGVELFCVSPGSRSAPLTVAVARHPQAQPVVCHDERGAAFYALGYAKATGKPAALIATSGTAGANHFPAVIEASMDHTPMLILTADRPPELQESGANQTIRQNDLYGHFTRRKFLLPCPEEKIAPEYLLSTVDLAVAAATGSNPGPVHLNLMFREPLAPIEQPFIFPKNLSYKKWAAGDTPFTRHHFAAPAVDEQTVREILPLLTTAQTPLLIVGRCAFGKHQNVAELIRRLQWPTHIDVTHPLRFVRLPAPIIDDFSRSDDQPDVVLQLGGAFISKRLQQRLEAAPPKVYLHVHPFEERIDPGLLVTQRVLAQPERLAEAALPHLPQPPPFTSANDDRLDALLFDQLSEPAAARLISELLPKEHALFLGNSMPVRDMNLFAARGSSPRRVGANRGVSGIDGTVASAAGFAHGVGAPTTLLIGDLALLHDLNSLLLVKRSPQPLTIVVVNNNGGGIFSFLPIAQFREVFDFFQTPHGLNFRAAAELFGLDYRQPHTINEFREAFLEATERATPTLIEVVTDGTKNLELHRRLEKAMAERG